MRAPLIVLLFLLSASTAVADQFRDASDWLERMSRSMAELDYQGTFVYLQGDDVETMRITHVVGDSGVRERLVAVSGPEREVVRDAHGVRSLIGEQQLIEGGSDGAGSVFPEFPADALKQARKRYIFEVGRSGRIAGHQGRKISILPKDEYRYGYELWLQEETGLLLRWVLYDDARKVLAKLMFTELIIGGDVNPVELESLAPQLPAVTAGGTGESGTSADEFVPVSRPRGMPPGFRLAARGQSAAAANSQHLVYSDGLATVSVYIEPAVKNTEIASGLSRMGTTNAWSHQGSGRRVTAIGEVPAITVRKIGNAFSNWQP